MKAMFQVRYGSPDFLELREIPRPELADNGVLVRVRAASINSMDWRLMQLVPRLIARLVGLRRSRVPGADVAGLVEAIGAKVTRFKPGDEVFGTANGSLAEYAAASEDHLVSKPHDLSFRQAAALPVAGCTAVQGLRDKAGLQPGQRVIVYGAGGGVGTFAVQIAKALGAHVTAVTRTANLDLVRSIGADEAIDYTRSDFTRGGQQYDVLFDIGANRSFADCRRALVPHGIHVIAGAPEGWWAIVSGLVGAQIASRRHRVVSYMARITPEDLVTLAELVRSGKLVPVIEREYALAEAPGAIRQLGAGQARGKIVIDVS